MESNYCQNVVSNRDLDDLCLPCTTRRYQYQGMERFEDVVGHLQHQFLDHATIDNEYVVFCIDKATFMRDFLEGDGAHILYTFEPVKNLLVVKTAASLPHMTAVDAFTDIIKNAQSRMRLEDTLYSYGGVVIQFPHGAKVPDGGWGPKRPPGQGKKPTVALEIGGSETHAKLRRDAEMWVDPARANAGIALAMKINARIPLIKFEKVEWNITTQQSQPTQVITMSKDESGQVKISGCPLVISFDVLYQRAPVFPVERDIQIDEESLRRMAEKVWDAQGFA